MLSNYKMGLIRANPKEYEKSDLHAYLKAKGIKGVSGLNKTELIDMVKLNKLKKDDLIEAAKRKKLNAPRRINKSDLFGLVKKKITSRVYNQQNVARRLKQRDQRGYDGIDVDVMKKFAGYHHFRVIYARLGEGSVEEMYDAYMQFLQQYGNEYILNHMVFYIRSLDGRHNRYLSVKSRNLNFTSRHSFMDSISHLLALEADEETGSDVIDPATEYLEKSRFDVYMRPRREAHGRKSLYLFKTEGVHGGRKGKCVFDSLNHVLGDNILSENDFISLALYDIHNLKKYCEEMNINILLSTIRYNENIFEMSNDREIVTKCIFNPRRKMTIYPLRTDFIRPIYMFEKIEDSIGTLLLDIDGEHCDVLKGNEITYNDIYFTSSGDMIIKNGDEYTELKNYRQQEIEKENMRFRDEFHEIKDENGVTIGFEKEFVILGEKDPKPKGKQYVDSDIITRKRMYFDYETVVDFSLENPIIPVSIGYATDDFENVIDEFGVEKQRKMKPIRSHGENCTYDMLKIVRESIDVAWTFISYNGSRFDNYILYNEILKLYPDSLSDAFFVKNQLLNFKFMGVHDTFDLCKHINMPLKDACEGYKIEYQKEELDFYEVQKKYDAMTPKQFNDFLNNDKEYNSYLDHDVLCLRSLFNVYETGCQRLAEQINPYDFECFNTDILESDDTKEITKGNMEITSKHEKLMISNIMKRITSDITKKKTLGGMMMDLLTTLNSKKKVKLPLFTKDTMKYFKDLEKDRIGGRVQLFNGKQYIEGLMNSIDCSGLYPYVMAVMEGAYYGCGEIVECKKYSDMPKDKIGFFYCKDIDQSKLDVKILPKRGKDKTNDWDIDDVITDKIFLSSIKIDMLRRHGCKLKTMNGIYFTEKIKGCDLFSFILTLMQFKTEEDIKKDDGKNYNAALRQLIKSMMLILSGKFAESLYLEKTKIVSESEMEKNDIKYSMKSIIGSVAVVNEKVSEEDALKHSQPIYISSLVYDYSQQYMYENVYTKVKRENLVMTDTDSNKLREADFKYWLDKVDGMKVPHWPEVEEYDSRYKTATIYAPTSRVKVLGSFADEYIGKQYDYHYYIQKKGYFNGSNSEDPNILKKNSNMKFKGIKAKDVYLKDFDEEAYDKLSEKERNDYYHTSKKIEDDYKTFFKDLYENGTVKVLCQSLTKDKNRLGIFLKTQVKTIKTL